MATLKNIRKAAARSTHPLTGAVIDTDVSAGRMRSVQIGEIVAVKPPQAELLDGSIVEIKARVAGKPIRRGDIVLVVKVARWFIVIGELEEV